MPVFKRLVQNPSSPDKDIKAAGAARYKQSTFARLTDTNALSRDLNDQIAYTGACGATSAATVSVTTKKGVIKVTSSATSALLTISLTNAEFASIDAEKFFVQTSLASATNVIYTSRIIPMTSAIGEGIMNIAIAQPTSTTWGTIYLNYEIVKIGD
jgi:hypothetical protein